LVPFFLTLHNLEEMFGMPAALTGITQKIPGWAIQALPTNAFPPTFRQFVIMLIAVTSAVYIFAALPGSRKPRSLRTFLLTGTQMVMLINVGSHVIMMNLQNSYVPGLATALLFNLPFSLILLGQGLRQRWLFWRDFYFLIPLALLAHGPGLLGLTMLSAQVMR
jgi:hypothetical protein